MLKLVIGNKNYSTWSLRPWLMLTSFKIPFEEIQVSLIADGRQQRLGIYSSSCKVPVLMDGNLHLWDSLAICEYISENYLDGAGWPANRETKAIARSISAEMHSSFTALRNEMPMNCRAKRLVEISDQAQQDINRIDTIWTEYRQQFKDNGPWLMGEFSIADCMYAPVIMRFITYNITLSDLAQHYADTVLTHPALQSWRQMALLETEVIAEDEAGIDIS